MLKKSIENKVLDVITAASIMYSIGIAYDIICDALKFDSPTLLECTVLGAGTYLLTKFLRN